MTAMTTTAPALSLGKDRQTGSGPAALALEFFRREPALATGTLAMLFLMAPTLLAMAADPRTFLGQSVWLKPLKFEISIALFMGTLAWFAVWVPAAVKARRWFRLVTWGAVAAALVEMIWIGGAAAFGTASHFNTASPIMSAIYPAMGAIATFLLSVSLIVAVLINRNPETGLSPALKLSLVLGLGLTFFLTLGVAGYMAQQTGHLVGGSGTDAGGLFFFAWSRDGGDLRVAHFFATHAMHFIPLLGLAASRLLPEAAARNAVIAGSLLFVGFTLYTLVEAALGHPFLALLT